MTRTRSQGLALAALAALVPLAGCEVQREDGKVQVTVDARQAEREAEQARRRVGEGLERVGKRLQEGEPVREVPAPPSSLPR
jgi:hypothetical protein